MNKRETMKKMHMNAELRSIAKEAMGGDSEILDTLWFNVFCQKFAHLLLAQVEMESKK